MLNAKEQELLNKAKKLTGEFRGALFLFLNRKDLKTVKFKDGKFYVKDKVITPKQLQILMRRLDIRIANKMAEYTLKLERKEWDVETWRQAMIDLLESSHVLFAALALGSLTLAVTDSRTNRRIYRDLSYLGAFAAEINQGRYLSLIGRATSRVRAYARSFHILYELINYGVHKDLGYTEARRILTANESCKRQENIRGCIDFDGIWLPIEKMPPIGSLVCGQFCKCYLIYRKGPEIEQTSQPKEVFPASVVRNPDGSLKLMFHGSENEIKKFDLSKVRDNDLDAPFNGFWFANTKRGASPALRDPKYMHEVHLDIKNPITRAEVRALRRSELKDLNGSEFRIELERRGYDGVKWEYPPEIDAKVLRETGSVEFKGNSGSTYRLVQEGDYLDYYGPSDPDPITSYDSLEDFMDHHSDEIWVAFKPDQIRINRSYKL